MAWPVLGYVVFAGGLALNYDVARRMDAGSPSCFLNSHQAGGCLFEALLSPFVVLGGGAMVAGYAWKLGEHDAGLDLGSGRLPKDTSNLRTFGLILGGLGLLVTEVLDFYVLSKVETCNGIESAGVVDIHGCFSSVKTLALVGDAASLLVGVGAPMVGYGFGYHNYVGRHSQPQLSLLPLPTPVRAGLALVGSL